MRCHSSVADESPCCNTPPPNALQRVTLKAPSCATDCKKGQASWNMAECTSLVASADSADGWPFSTGGTSAV